MSDDLRVLPAVAFGVRERLLAIALGILTASTTTARCSGGVFETELV